MTDYDRWDTAGRATTAAETATDPRWRSFMAALAEWLKNGGPRPSFAAHFGAPLPRVREEFYDDGRDVP